MFYILNVRSKIIIKKFSLNILKSFRTTCNS